LEYWPTPLGIYKHVVKSKMQENIFFFLRNPCKNTFLKFQIFVFLIKNVKNMLGYWPYATHKKNIMFCQNTNNTIKSSIIIKETSRTHLYFKIHCKLKTIQIKQSLIYQLKIES